MTLPNLRLDYATAAARRRVSRWVWVVASAAAVGVLLLAWGGRMVRVSQQRQAAELARQQAARALAASAATRPTAAPATPSISGPTAQQPVSPGSP